MFHGADNESDVNTNKLPKRLSQFDEDKLVSFFLQRKNNERQCCGSTCYPKLQMEQVRSEAMLLGFRKQNEPPDARNRMYRGIVMNEFMCNTNKSGNVMQYRLLTVSQRLCQKAWLQLLLFISEDIMVLA